MKVVPQAFYENSVVQKILVDGLNCVIYKKVNTESTENGRYLSTHAITVVLNGCLRIENEEGLRLVRSGQMIFLPRGLYMISDIIPDDSAFEALVFFFDQSISDQFLGQVQRPATAKTRPSDFIFPFTTELHLFVQNLFELYQKGPLTHKAITKGKLMEFLHLISLSKEGQRFQSVFRTLEQKKKRSLSDFMKANFDKPLSVEDYAYLTGRSISTFHRDFKRQFEMAPKQWLITQRLAKAEKLLSENFGTVNAVAHEVGYENISHFIKAFQKRYGSSPKQFMIRKRNNIQL